jgi:hypothetical protein
MVAWCFSQNEVTEGKVVYLSGSKEDYNHWADLAGDDTWSWEESHRRLKEVGIRCCSDSYLY